MRATKIEDELCQALKILLSYNINFMKDTSPTTPSGSKKAKKYCIRTPLATREIAY